MEGCRTQSKQCGGPFSISGDRFCSCSKYIWLFQNDIFCLNFNSYCGKIVINIFKRKVTFEFHKKNTKRW